MRPPFPLPLILGIALAVAILSAWSILRSATLTTRKGRALALALRLCALALATGILCNPSDILPLERPTPSGAATVLVDRSLSMGGARTESADAAAQAVLDAALPGGTNALQFGEKTRPWKKGDKPNDTRSDLCHAILETLGGGHPPSAIVVASDGRVTDAANRDELFRALAGGTVPVFVLPATAPFDGAPNLRITSCEWDAGMHAGEKAGLRLGVACQGSDVQSGIARLFDGEGAPVAEIPLSFADGKAQARAGFTMPDLETVWRIEVAPLAGETYLEDNRVEIPLAPRHDAIRVLYMEGSPESLFDFGETRMSLPVNTFLPRAWSKDGMEVDLYFTPEQNQQTLVRASDNREGFCPTRAEVNAYDVVVCSDVARSNFSDEQLEWVRELVADKGGGFLMIGGDTSFGDGGWQRTVWEKLIPFSMTGEDDLRDRQRPFRMQFEPDAYAHPVLHLLKDPAKNKGALDQGVMMNGSCLVKSAKPGATVLARNPEYDGMPVLAVQDYGRGRTMGFTSDAAGGWGHRMMQTWGPVTNTGSTNLYYRTFWTNAIHWLAGNRIADRGAKAELRPSTLNLDAGESCDFALRLLELKDADVSEVSLALSDGRRLQMTRTAPALWTAKAVPTQVGTLTAAATVLGQAGRELAKAQTTLHVRASLEELRDTRPDAAFLEALARVSGGRVHADAKSLVADLGARLRGGKDAKAAPFAVPAWDRAWLLLLLVALLGAEWAWRRHCAG